MTIFPRSRLSLAGALVVLSACGKLPSPPPAQTPHVKTVAARTATIPVTKEYAGRVSAYRSLEIRARVEGVIAARHFIEGSKVKKGDLLFTLDRAPFEAVLANARAELAGVDAVLTNARSREARFRPLVKETAISQMDYNDAVAALDQAEAQRAAALAHIAQAELNLGYTRVSTTQEGRIGAALVPEGRLVGKGEATHLATVERIDQVYVTFTVADSEALALRKAIQSGAIEMESGGAVAKVTLPDGSTYKEAGKLDFADMKVNGDTGTVALRAVIDNPNEELLPGLYVRVMLTLGQRPNAVLIPQKSVVKTPTGQSVFVIDAEHKVERRDLVLGSWAGEDWIVEKGLAAGEQVVVEGVQKVRPGIEVTSESLTPVASQP
jgi:membrane fusion protein (multidrug efflux system)